MQAELEKLLILQDRDQKIRQIGLEIKTLPQQRKNLEAQLAATAASLESLKQRARQLEVERKNSSSTPGPGKSISPLKTQQYETRKNDEFRAMGNEIERYEKEMLQIEDQELELMEQADKVARRGFDRGKDGNGGRDCSPPNGRSGRKSKTLQARLNNLRANKPSSRRRPRRT